MENINISEESCQSAEPDLSPLDAVPNEIIAMILVSLSARLQNRERFWFPLTTPQLISRRWRDITLSTPALWTTVYMDRWIPPYFLIEYISRSGKMGLNLEMMRLDNLPILLLHISRWRRLSIWIHDPGQINTLLETMVAKSISLLHFSCAISGSDFEGQIATMSPITASLQLLMVNVNWGTTPKTWEHLGQLVLAGGYELGSEDVDLENFTATLRACKKLKGLMLSGFSFKETDIVRWLSQSRTSGTIILADLQELVLRDFYTHELLFLVFEIQCPDLRSLGIGLISSDDQLNPDIDWTGLAPAYPNLEQFDLWSIPLDPKQLHLVIRGIPPVSVLGIRGSYLGYSEDKTINPIHFRQVFEPFVHFGSSVRVIWTRMVDASTLLQLFHDWFPNTESIHMHWDDVATVESESGEAVIVDDLSELPNVIFWGKEARESWYLETLEGQVERVHRVIRAASF